jgi:hypothetical protein
MERTGDRLQVVSGGKNSVRSDQAPDLEQKRIERGEVEDPEGTKKNPAPPEMSGGILTGNLRAKQPVDRPLDSLFHRTRLYRGNARRTAGFGLSSDSPPDGNRSELLLGVGARQGTKVGDDGLRIGVIHMVDVHWLANGLTVRPHAFFQNRFALVV